MRTDDIWIAFFSPVISALLAVARRKVGTSTRGCNIIGTCDYLRSLSIWISCVLTSIAGIARFPFLSIVIFKSLNTIVFTVCSARIYRFERKVFLFFSSQKSSGTAGIRWRSITWPQVNYASRTAFWSSFDNYFHTVCLLMQLHKFCCRHGHCKNQTKNIKNKKKLKNLKMYK